MKLISAVSIAVFLLIVCLPPVDGQSLLKRTTYKTDKFDFGAGGTISVIGAPNGSIQIEGGQRNEIEISAEIEVQAATEADLATLAGVTGFVLEESPLNVSINSVGTHDKKGMGKAAKKFPKALFGLPFRINYVIKVPHYCDLDVNGGKGNITISGVEGSIKVNSVDSTANMSLIGGVVSGTFGTGDVTVTMPNRSWRGGTVDIALNSGTMSLNLPWNLSGDLEASILRTGKIENGLTNLKPKDRHTPFTEKTVSAKAGSGGVPMKFTVGDGTLKLIPLSKP